VQAEDAEAPVEGELGRLGAQPLAAPLAQVDPELGAGVAVVDVKQRAPADRSLVGAVIDGEVAELGLAVGMTRPLALATSRSFSQRW
jgi:hypothetical protein